MREQTIALAGMLQTGELVRQVATSGNCSHQAADASIRSIFNLNPASTEDVFGGLGGVRMGLRVAVELLGGGAAEQDSLQSFNYALGMAKLGSRLHRDSKRQRALGQELKLVESAWKDAGEDGLEPSVISQLGDVYQRHVSTMDYRITVNGRPEYLKQAEKVAMIRSLLLAGLRAAVLWRQVGGRQWRLIFQRRKILHEAQVLLTA